MSTSNNKGKGRVLPVVGVIVVIGIILTAGWKYKQTDPSSEVPQKVPIRPSTYFTAIDYAPYVVAKKKGWFEELKGYEVIHLDPFQSPAPVNEAFSGNKVDGVLTAEIPTIVGRAAGIDVKIGWMCATLQSEIVVRKDTGIVSLSGLKGKRIAVMAGTGPHFGLLHSLQEIGLTRNDVEIFDMVPPDARAAFRSGQAEAWAIWPPNVEQEVLSGAAQPLPDVKTPVQILLCVDGDFAMAHKAGLDEVVRILERGRDWIQKNPEQAQALLAEDLGLDVEVVKASWPKIQWNVSISPSVVDDIQAKAQFLKNEGFVEKLVNVREELLVE